MSKQINFQERQLIELWLKNSEKIRQIAQQLNRSPSSISDEIKRNGDKNGYHAISAQTRSKNRISKSRIKNSLKKDWITDYIINKLRCGWSPELIAGRLRREHGKTIILTTPTYTKPLL